MVFRGFLERKTLERMEKLPLEFSSELQRSRFLAALAAVSKPSFQLRSLNIFSVSVRRAGSKRRLFNNSKYLLWLAGPVIVAEVFYFICLFSVSGYLT